MRRFTWVSGRLTEVQRFINVPMRWCEQYPARERRELWVTTAEGEDFKLVVHTRAMPARCGHQVVGVLLAGRLVGLHNLSNGEAVNFALADPPLLWRRCDGAVVALLSAAAAVAASAHLYIACFGGCLAAMMYAPSVIVGRWIGRRMLIRAIDLAIDSAKRQATGRPRLRRIK